MQDKVVTRRRRRRRRSGRRPRRSVRCPSTAAGSAPSRPSACCGAPGSARAGARRQSSRGRASTARSQSLTRPPAERLTGPAPKDEDGRPLAPFDAYGHDQLWWLDKMVRTNRPLVERMTLVWHDWFATSNDEVGSPRLMIGQNNLFRRRALSSFEKLLLDVTQDPAMLVWLSGSGSTKDAPNENYARELMELFTLGVGRGYSERDVREQARALTGFTNDWDDEPRARQLPLRARAARRRREEGVRQARALRLARLLPALPRAQEATRRSSSASCGRTSSRQRRPPAPRTRSSACTSTATTPCGRWSRRSCAIPTSTAARGWSSRRSSTSPGCCAAWAAASTPSRGSGSAELAGQQLFYPPDVAGWEDDRWLDTSTWRGRWLAARLRVEREALLEPGKDPPIPDETPGDGRRPRARVLGQPDDLARRRAGAGAVRPALPRRRRTASGSRSTTRSGARTRCA